MGRIALINSPIRTGEPPRHAPLGLAILYGVIDRLGYEVGLLDANAYRLDRELVRRDLKEEAEEVPYDMIGLSGLITTYRFQRDLIPHLRKDHPETLLIAGGGCASSIPKEMLEWNPDLDMVVIGEGEKTIVDVIKHLGDREFSGIPGIAYRDGDEIVLNPPRPLMTEQELDKLPHPAFGAVPMEEVYFKNSALPLCPETVTIRRRIDLATGRGCPYSCTFCMDLLSGRSRTHFDSSLGKKIRWHSMKYVASLLRHIRLKHSCDFVALMDECFTANRKRVFEFCDMLEEEELAGLFRWGTTAHVKTIDAEMLSRMREVGCSYLDLGFESASDRILKSVKKRATARDNQRAFDMCMRAGIYPITNFMFGFPGESAQTVLDTARFLKRNQILCKPFFITPYPGCQLYEENREKILDQHNTLEKFVLSLGDATDFSVNLTRFDTPTLLGLRELVSAQRVDLIEEWQKKAKPEPGRGRREIRGSRRGRRIPRNRRAARNHSDKEEQEKHEGQNG